MTLIIGDITGCRMGKGVGLVQFSKYNSHNSYFHLSIIATRSCIMEELYFVICCMTYNPQNAFLQLFDPGHNHGLR